MQAINSRCDEVQMEISSALDEGAKIPDAALEHAETCPDCAAFLKAWTGGIPDLLRAPLPPAGLELRNAVLTLPHQAERANQARSRYRNYASAAAAAVVLALLGYSLIDVRPGKTEVVKSETLAQKELAALKADFREGISALRGPASAMQRVLNP
ncbi:MAG: hypothetical protein MUF31_17405 [Akkermansiaceae bacterium]|jgi:hypothetical protein|nr:hypothetical protein [Akkermansiaceae bacterium]